MKLRARDSDNGDLLNGRIELAPGGERAPRVTLDDGTSLGSLMDVWLASRLRTCRARSTM